MLSSLNSHQAVFLEPHMLLPVSSGLRALHKPPGSSGLTGVYETAWGGAPLNCAFLLPWQLRGSTCVFAEVQGFLLN